MTPALLLPLLLAAARPAAAAPELPVSTAALVETPDEAAELGLSSAAIRLPLEDAVAAAVARRLTLLVSRTDLESARGALKTQRGTYDPTLSLQASGSGQLTRTIFVPGSVPPPTDQRTTAFDGSLSQNLPTGGKLSLDVNDTGKDTIPFPTLHQAAATLTLSQPLLRGAGPAAAYASVAAAFAAVQGAEASARRALEQAVADAEDAYWQLMQAEAQEDAARLSMLAGDRLLARNEELEKRRLIASYDVLTAEAGSAQRRATFIQAARARRDAMDALAFAVFGEETARLFKADAYEIRTTSAAPGVPELPPAAQAEDDALRSRADLQAQRYGLEQADVSLAQLRRDALPDLAATGSFGGTGNYQTGQDSARWDAVRRALRGDDRAWSLGLSLTVPLLLRADRGRYESGLAAREKQRLAVVAAENQVRLDVRAAARAVRLESRRFEEERLVADLYARQLEGEQKRLELGLSDSYRVLLVERDATQAKLDLASARAALSSALTGYRLAVGTIAAEYRKNP